MSVRARKPKATVTLSRTIGLPSGTPFNAFNFGAWFRFDAWPSSNQDLIALGPESGRAVFGVDSTGQIYLTLDGAVQGTTSALSLRTWYFIGYCKTGGTTHEIRLTYYDHATGATTTPTTEIAVTHSHASTTALAFELYVSSNYRVCNVKFQQGATVSPAVFMGDRVSWFPTNQIGYVWAALRTPLDLSSFLTAASASAPFEDKYFWQAVSGPLVREADPPHLLTQACYVSTWQAVTGAQLGHDPLPALSPQVYSMPGAGWIGYRAEDDGRLPAEIEFVSMTFDGHTTFTGSGLAAQTDTGYITIPYPGGGFYRNSPKVGNNGYTRGAFGSIAYFDGFGYADGLHPLTGLPVTREDLYSTQLDIQIEFGNNPLIFDTPCRTWVMTAIGMTVVYRGDYNARPRIPISIQSSVPCCNSGCSCDAPHNSTGSTSQGSGSRPLPSATGPILPPVDPSWTPQCEGGGEVPTAPDPVDPEDWSQW